MQNLRKTAAASGVVCCFLLTVLVVSAAAEGPTLRAGAAAVDVTPQQLPVIRNGGFLEAQDDRVIDPLYARCLVLDDGKTRLAIVVVDSCMIPLDVCDQAKAMASEETQIPVNRILISATHTHSAPSVMDFCLGSRADQAYRAFLPSRISAAIAMAEKRLAPARIGWGVADAAAYTKCRRWITRSDHWLVDPFGEKTVHAMMHPGHQNPQYVGPSGPIDPWLSVLNVQTAAGEPIAALANFSMHYFGGHPGISADYFGLFARRLAKRLAPDNPDFVGIMSQGTSGDTWWGDYSVPADKKPFKNMDHFTDGLVQLAKQVCDGLDYRADVLLGMAEERMTLNRRTPSAERLAWARRMLRIMGERRPQNRPEVYAEQAIYLHEHPTEEVVLQAIRIGELGITALPNEVYALTGLKLKAQSPLPTTFNIELANAASGYIPPPEQHALGGYTTWPARTAGLEVEAEPKIVEATLKLLERVADRPRRKFREAATAYSRAVLESQPDAYWRLADMSGPTALDASGNDQELRCDGLVAYHLSGRAGGGGNEGNPFGSVHHRHAVQLAGGKLVADDIDLDESYTVELSFYLGTPRDFRDITALLLTRGTDQLAITGKSAQMPGRLVGGGVLGESDIVPLVWHHLVYVRNGDYVEVYLNGRTEPEISTRVPRQDDPPRQLYIGGDASNTANFEGKIDELSVYRRALSKDEVGRHFQAAGYQLPQAADAVIDPPPLDPESALRQIHVRDGFRVELVAAEPLTRDPVAIDWGWDGRLWVAEMADYPMGMDNQGAPGGRVRWLADSDGDGTFDESVVFLDGIPFPTGVMAWRDGILVTAAPEIFYAEDTDGDGVADRREILFSGFIQGNQQLRVNGLRWGLDNWIHCASGGHHAGFGTDTKIFSAKTGTQVPLGSRDLRFQAETGQIEPLSGPSQYGRVRDDWGNWFGVQNSQPLWHYVVADRYLRRNKYVALPDPRRQVRVPLMPRVYSAKPPQKRFHGFDHPGHYTSACGISLYRDELLFPRGATQHAFTCEPFHNLVQHHVLTEDGTSFLGRRGDDGPLDFFAASDRWCRPVMTRTGPDGALWVVDMYRYMIEHPEWLPDRGKEELRPFYRAGEQFGRIYRIVPDDDRNPKTPRLGAPTKENLVATLSQPNGILRDMAHQRLLANDSENAGVIHELRELAGSHALPEVRLQSLCVLDGMQALSRQDILRACDDAHAAVRRQAIRLAEKHADTTQPVDGELVAAVCRRASDDDAKVRLQVACTLGDWMGLEAGRASADLAMRDNNDEYMWAAIISSAGNHYSSLVDAAITGADRTPTPLLEALLAMGVDRRDDLSRLLEHYIDKGELRVENLKIVSQWLDILGARNLTWRDVRDRADDRLAAVLTNADSIFAASRGAAVDNQRELSLRSAAIGLLGRDADQHHTDITLLAGLLTPQTPPRLQLRAIERLAGIPSADVAQAILSKWRQLLPEVQLAATDVLLSRTQWTRQLIDYVRQGKILAIDIQLTHQNRLLGARDQKIAAAAREVFGQDSNSDRSDILAEYNTALSLIGNVDRGAVLFKENCQNCHNLEADQLPVGPDLRGLTDRSSAALLTAILDPSRSIEPRFLSYNIELQTGEILVGVVVREDSNSITIANTDGNRRGVLRETIDTIERSRLSIMPVGFETKMKPQDVADVIAFVNELGQ